MVFWWGVTRSFSETRRRGQNEPIDRKREVEFCEVVYTLGCVELASSQRNSFLALRIRSREDNHFTSHLGRELDGDMAESTYSYDANTVYGFHVLYERCEDRRTATCILTQLLSNLKAQHDDVHINGAACSDLRFFGIGKSHFSFQIPILLNEP
ncbi:nadp-dependent alcohol dehydrogenase [Moniliophthora roreri]|nr:nadp-dependent alcohol dehydrogenase [Moniliophthora roreri]